MAKKERILTSIPVVPPGLANCHACQLSELRGGSQGCPIETLRDHDNPAISRMQRSARGEFFDCGGFKPLGKKMAEHRLGVHTEKHRDRSREGQEALF